MPLPVLSSPRRSILAAAVLVCLSIAGCDDGNPPVQPTRGSLYINGAPAEGAAVAFHPVGGDFDKQGTRPGGTVAADGSFSLSTFGPDDGAPAGEYTVTVVWPLMPGALESPDRLGRRFAVPSKSPLRKTIEEGENELDEIRLDGVPVMTGRRR